MEDPVILELRSLTAIVKLAFASQIQETVRTIVSTEDRRRIWTAINGKLNAAEISTKLKIPKRTVYYFLSTAEQAGLVLAPKGKHPVKLVAITLSRINSQSKKEVSPTAKGE